MKLELRYIRDLIKDFKSGKKVILYGSREETENLIKFINLYDLSPYCIVNDMPDGNIKTVSALRYEHLDDIFVLICKADYMHVVDELERYGLKQSTHFRVLGKNRYANLHQEFPLDVNIGYTYSIGKLDVDFPGVTIFGDIQQENAYKIVTLGSSTSDAQSLVWRSWSEILYDTIKDKYSNVVIMAAGVSGYKSSQELLRLMRDFVGMKPQMVISFSGVNDIGSSRYPFVPYYVKRNFDEFSRLDLLDINGAKTVSEYSCGFPRVGSVAENWLRHMRMMKAICEEFEIVFYPFLEPMIGSKKNNLSANEWEQILNGDNDILKNTDDFLTEVRNAIKEEKIDFIEDISTLFDDLEDIYVDAIHVTEEGNHMIADKVFQIIERELAMGASLQ